ncbi:hypothetical protein [Marinomonas sp. MED121]|uniref:hypothetical protein n=1 Tax=Marinomonas sp. MED121 TaxID=314277 RepID=UPI0005606ABC|nr:hypothetical protein [Marinomonas sp. MED121]
MKKIFVMLFCLCSFSVYAGNAWYFGKVTKIYTLGSDGSFQISVNNSSLLSNCLYERVNFSVTNMGAERTKAALSMAMTAFASGKEWGVVVDIANSGEICEASSTASQGAGVR